ncbi:hypothetical protein BDR26DRAFT_874614 [Obelidium mucronatum]|nr:hypothetical protein BDR26DRAFT_874614 [Obelidium mucronatum]
METVAARSKSNSSINNNDAQEFIALNDEGDEDDVPYVHPRNSAAQNNNLRSMSSPSIRMVRKRSSVAATPLFLKSGEKRSDASDQLPQNNQEQQENDEDEVPYVMPPPTMSTRSPSSSSIRMVRKRASVLQQALEHPSRSLSQALLEKKALPSKSNQDENDEDAPEFVPLNDEIPSRQYAHPSSITARTASKASIDLLRRMSSSASSSPSSSSAAASAAPLVLDQDSVIDEVSKLGRVDPETGSLLNESHAEIVVTASGIVKTEKRSMSTPHIHQQVPNRKSSPPSALRNLLEGARDSPTPPPPFTTTNTTTNETAASKRMSSNPSMIHPTLSLPRPPKKGVNNRHSDILMTNGGRTQSFSSASNTSSTNNSPSTPTRSPLSEFQRNPLTDTTSVVFNTASKFETLPSRPGIDEYAAPPIVNPPRIRRESSIGIVAEQTGKALSSAFSYLSKAASTYLEATPSSSSNSTANTPTTASTTTTTTTGGSSSVPEPSHFFVTNNDDTTTTTPPPPTLEKLVSPKASQSTLASAFAYFSGSVGVGGGGGGGKDAAAAASVVITPKPVVEPPQLYGQSRTPITTPEKKKSLNVTAAAAPPPAYGLGSGLAVVGGGGGLVPKVGGGGEERGISGVVEDWWKRGFGGSSSGSGGGGGGVSGGTK